MEQPATPGFKKVPEVPFPMHSSVYIHSMIYVDVPQSEEHLLGGNVTAMLWREQDEPRSWRLTYRFRYNNSLDPADRRDTKNWYVGHITSDEPDKIVSAFKNTIQMSALLHFKQQPALAEVWEINGDTDKFVQMLQTNPPQWMHVTFQPANSNAKV